MKLFSRNALPADARAALTELLGHRPRVLAWGRTEVGALAALPDRLVHVHPDDTDQLGWHDILSGGWDLAHSSMHWTRMSTGEKFDVVLTEPNRFPEVFKERVEATILFQQAVYPRPGKAITISARRNLVDAGEPVLWTAHPGRGVRMDEEAMAFAQAELARLRAEYAF